MTEWLQWIRAHQVAIWWLAGISVSLFLVSLLVVPFIVVRIPHDYFNHRKRPASRVRRHPAAQVIVLVSKNAVGILLLLMGFAMLILPGQGILAVVAGLMLLSFPGKYRLQRWLVSRRPVLRSINWLRRRANRDPLVVRVPQPQRRPESRKGP